MGGQWSHWPMYSVSLRQSLPILVAVRKSLYFLGPHQSGGRQGYKRWGKKNCSPRSTCASTCSAVISAHLTHSTLVVLHLLTEPQVKVAHSSLGPHVPSLIWGFYCTSCPSPLGFSPRSIYPSSSPVLFPPNRPPPWIWGIFLYIREEIVPTSPCIVFSQPFVVKRW
jgi:hypothetical protein